MERKGVYYDRYWKRADTRRRDKRSLQRARTAFGLIRLKGGRLLDVGCGRGVVSRYFQRRGFDVMALDISEVAVSITRRRGIRAEVLDVESHVLNGDYDAILCLEVLEHLRDPVSVVRKLRNLLNKRGKLVISLPNERSLLSRTLSPWHLHAFDPARARRFVRDTGLAIAGQAPIPLIPPWGAFSEGCGRVLARLSPQLFSISSMFCLEEHRKNGTP
jgi:2-polyprenyl-3-methyl-5-hydroxy-6-metoxy-1,4-benzoquinol methylase